MGRTKAEHFEFIKTKKLYRKRIKDADGKYVAIYANTEKELSKKIESAKEEIKRCKFHNDNPTLDEYLRKWLDVKKSTLKYTTIVNYETVYNIITSSDLGSMYMCQIRPEHIKLMLAECSDYSKSVVKKIKMMLKGVFDEACDNGIIDYSPYTRISKFTPGKETEEKEPLTDEQVVTLFKAVEGHRIHTFIAIAYFAGLRREEILGLKWENVDLDSKSPHIRVQYTWHIEHNRGVIVKGTKTKKGNRTVPIPPQLVNILRESKKRYPSEYVIPNIHGGALSGTQWQQLWEYVTVRTIEPRVYYRYDKNGNKVEHVVNPVLGEKAKHNNTCVYSMDFHVTPHILRHTCITNWIYAGADIKTVQEWAGHEDPNTTLKIYAHVKKHDAEGQYKTAEDIFGNLEKKNVSMYNIKCNISDHNC